MSNPRNLDRDATRQGGGERASDGTEASAPPIAANGEAANDALTGQLRRLYGTIADEPMPASITALLERLKR